MHRLSKGLRCIIMNEITNANFWQLSQFSSRQLFKKLLLRAWLVLIQAFHRNNLFSMLMNLSSKYFCINTQFTLKSSLHITIYIHQPPRWWRTHTRRIPFSWKSNPKITCVSYLMKLQQINKIGRGRWALQIQGFMGKAILWYSFSLAKWNWWNIIIMKRTAVLSGNTLVKRSCIKLTNVDVGKAR